MTKLSMSEEEMLKRKYTRPYEKRIVELEDKISVLLSCKKCPENKGGYICQKEYEDKCLSQKIQYIKELQEENAQWEQRNETLKDALEHARKIYGDELEKSYKEIAELKEELNEWKNEWHDLRKNPNDLPKECKGKLYLVNIYSDSQLKFEYAEYTPTVCLWSSEWKRFEILELTVGSSIVNIKSVIAWKEIVLPKESE
jgi:cell division protein FtsB